MFCPKCGKPEQQINTFCRSCGMFLPDFSKVKNPKVTPEEHLTANLVLNFMTAIASAVLAILLYYSFIGKEGTPGIIYITAGFLTAMFAWQVQIIIRTFLVKKHFKGRKNPVQTESATTAFESFKTKELLNEADFKDSIPAGVTENTTKNLNKISR